ncbi:MAG TPA: hypothetical protein VK255_03610 [Patescibacteria group bacterium]|nr:hypothetical protein [Patescibacteria group bacterium]
MSKRTKIKKGFYMIEAIIALFLISTGLLVAVDLMTSVSINTTRDRDNIIAAMLAQEGLEIVRNVRDNNFAIGDTAFANGFPAASSDNCRVSNIATTSVGITCDGSYVINLTGAKLYASAAGDSTKFQRRISIRYITIGATDYAKVTSVVTWKGNVTSISINNVASECIAENGCAYTQTNFTRWIE